MWALNGDNKPSTSLGLSIMFGSLLGLTMGANVWMIIWPNQQVNIASAEAVAAGGQADPAAAGAAMAAGRASRVNAFFSIPMAFFMVFTSHFAPQFDKPGGAGVVVWIIFLVIAVFAELSALGKLPGGLRRTVQHDGAGRPQEDDLRRADLHRRDVLHRLGADHRLALSTLITCVTAWR